MAEQLPPFKVLYDFEDVPTIRRFALSNKRVRMIMGPFGCLRGDSLIVTKEGLLPIAELTRPMQVLSWNEKTNQFQFSLSGGAFPKGRDYLYRIVTQRGEFVASGDHHVFCVDHKYRRVDSLRVNDSLLGCSSFPSVKFSELFPLRYRKDVWNFREKVLNLMGHCVRLARLYGLQLLREAYTDQSFVLKPTDAHILSSPYGLLIDERMGGLADMLSKHNQRDQSSSLKQTDDFYFPVEPQPKDVRDQILSRSFSRIGEIVQQFSLPLRNFFCHHIKKLLFLRFRSYSSSISEWPILSITRLSVKELYWDMQVLDTSNYVTTDGTIHHNSGKTSGCIQEIIRRAHMQAPGPDGIRRSRWAVVRNVFSQLKDTTIRSFHDWYPPKIFGEYRVTDHIYILTRFPGVHLEVLFRALDRPDQVSNLLSLEVTGAYFNEVREIPHAIIEAMDARIGRYPSKRDGGASWYGMIMDTNPPDEDSYLYKMFEKVRPDNWEIFKQPSGLSAHAENSKHLPKNYYVNLAKGKDEMYIRIYIHGQYGYLITGKPVFQSFVDNVHVAPHPLEPIKNLPLLTGWDWGLTPCVIIGQVTPQGQLRIIDELVSDGMGIKQFCENQVLPLLRLKYFGYKIMGFGDPAGVSRSQTDESTCFDILHSPEIGLRYITEAPTNSIVARIGAVEHFLNKMNHGDPGFLLSPICHHLRKGMNGGYHYEKDPKSTGDDFKIMPVKNFSAHQCDALQYLCMYVTDKESNDERHKKFLANMKRREYRVADGIVGY